MLHGRGHFSALDATSLLHRHRHNPVGMPIPAQYPDVEAAIAMLNSCHCTSDGKYQGPFAALTMEQTTILRNLRRAYIRKVTKARPERQYHQNPDWRKRTKNKKK